MLIKLDDREGEMGFIFFDGYGLVALHREHLIGDTSRISAVIDDGPVEVEDDVIAGEFLFHIFIEEAFLWKRHL